MSDEAPVSGPAPTAVRIVPDIPTIFADGSISQSWGPGVSKFYFGRIDADPHVQGAPTSTVVAQVIMPTEGFVAMVTFFEHRLKMMVEAGAVSQETIDRSRQAWIDGQA
ncbi:MULTISPECIES: hypothetical protein [Bradyrhizobium]|uniref:hypothetical protein n=1 Tax=Bradyrhizobium australafricanum TaxID=2821406 RepID=UPI001CE30922|nr:hypothetical protein [Bradyrhizobium australafricanum]MCA6105112.1 hypothetical protein [Bradyrhizobium australafricanum]